MCLGTKGTANALSTFCKNRFFLTIKFLYGTIVKSTMIKNSHGGVSLITTTIFSRSLTLCSSEC
ncbi:hypothetical protein JCM31598_25330 [Desulfonatronum parangueonense]